jgi:hypothetical protein
MELAPIRGNQNIIPANPDRLATSVPPGEEQTWRLQYQQQIRTPTLLAYCEEQRRRTYIPKRKIQNFIIFLRK